MDAMKQSKSAARSPEAMRTTSTGRRRGALLIVVMMGVAIGVAGITTPAAGVPRPLGGWPVIGIAESNSEEKAFEVISVKTGGCPRTLA